MYYIIINMSAEQTKYKSHTTTRIMHYLMWSYHQLELQHTQQYIVPRASRA